MRKSQSQKTIQIQVKKFDKLDSASDATLRVKFAPEESDRTSTIAIPNLKTNFL
jgi:hypothetical protein